MSKIERMIDGMEEFVEKCKPSLVSGKKITVVKDELLEFIDKLKLSIPEDLKMSKIVLDNEKEIIEKANKKAMEIIEAAKAEANKIVDESNLIEIAYAKADEIAEKAAKDASEILADANKDAADIRRGALSYASDMLSEVEKIFHHAYRESDKNYRELLGSMKYNIDVLSNNRNLITKELGQNAPVPEEVPTKEEKEEKTVTLKEENETIEEEVTEAPFTEASENEEATDSGANGTL